MIGGDKDDGAVTPGDADNQGQSTPQPAEGPDDTPPPTEDSPQG